MVTAAMKSDEQVEWNVASGKVFEKALVFQSTKSF